MKKTRKSFVVGLCFGLILLLACIVIFNIDVNGSGKDASRPAKYIFLFIGDGMGATQVAAAESYQSYLEGEKGFERMSFTQFPVLGMAETYSANKNVTCSSAAGTAISCGAKTLNGRLGITPEGDTLTSMAKILKEKGYKVAIMSSVPVNHATPAAVYAHNTDRNAYYEITQEIPASGYDLLAGSGFVDYAGKDGSLTGSKELLEANGYTVCFGGEEFDKAVESGAKNIVLCQKSYREKGAPTYIVEKEPESDITSEDLMEDCLEFLGDKSPFFIMYEQGEIDWAAHGNKTMPMVESVQKLDKAVKVALEFYRQHPDETLIIVTADHETGGITLGYGKGGEKSLGWNILDSAWQAAGHTNSLGYEENKAMNEAAYIGWTTLSHTGGPVPVYAIGKGAENFAGRYDNTEIKGKILGE